MVQETPFYLGVKDVSKTLGISERKTWELLHDQSNPLPHYRIGRKIVRVKTSELHKWMEQNWRVDHSEVDRIVNEIMG